MIQRKQTLFLLALVLIGAMLLFIPVRTVTGATASFDITLLPAAVPHSTFFLVLAIFLNIIALLLSAMAIFLYKKLELQSKLCKVIFLLWFLLTCTLLFATFVKPSPEERVLNHYLTAVFGLGAMFSALSAGRFVRKDIELLKSADRIR